jgi:hypothetical protein
VRRPAVIAALALALAAGGCLGGDDDDEVPPPRPAAAPNVTPRSAADFNQSIGVATHPTYFGTVHDREGEIAQLIHDAGIRHVRNGMAISDNAGWNERAWANMRAWPEHGLVSSWGVDRCSVTFEDENHTIRQHLDKIAEIDGDLSAAIEGTNEVNVYCGEGDWVARERRYVAALYREVKRHPDPVIRSLPVIGPSFGRAGAAAELGDVSRFVDVGNTHPYTGCLSPTPEHVQRYGIADYEPAGDSKPVFATEVGFHTAVNTVETDVQPPCDERSAAVYTLRTVLEHFNLGIRRTYLYEAVDLSPDPGRAKASWNFGILRNDLSPKPAYTYLANLLATTHSGASVDPTPLQLAVDRGPSDLRTLLLRRSDGAYVLALWRDASFWDRDARQPIGVEPEPVEVRLPTARSVAKVEQQAAPTEERLPVTGGRVALEITCDAVLLVIRGRSRPGA